MRIRFTTVLAVLSILGHPIAAVAQSEYPSRSITIIVPFPAGGVTDVVGRELARGLQAALKQTVVVENRAGAAGVIGTRLVAQAKPDGHTLGLLTVSAISIAPHVSSNVGYASLTDFTPISNAVTVAGAIVANVDKPYASLTELVKKAKEQPDRINYASVGPGSIPHLTAEMFSKAAGIKMMHVPYKGASPALQDLLAGHVDLSVETSLVTTVSSLSTGRLRVLAITGPERSPLMPEVPTVAESGFPGFSAQGWFGLFGPGGLPPKTLEVLSRVTRETLSDPEVIARLQKAGMTPAANSPSEFSNFLQAEDAKWAAIAKELNIKLD